jgi:hypothetical protein
MTKIVQYTHNAKTPQSSAFSEVWYSSTSRELFVKFRDSGQIAGYSDVSPLAADKFFDSASLGAHYAKYIKPNYPGVNTKDVEFRSAPGLAKKTTVAPTYGVYVAPAPKPAAKPKKTFYVSGVILKPVHVSEQFFAESFEEAIELFKTKYAKREPEVKEVRTV